MRMTLEYYGHSVSDHPSSYKGDFEGPSSLPVVPVPDYLILRAHGPYLFIGNWNRQSFHAVLVVGREESIVESRSIDEVIYIDPAVGSELNVSITFFNRRMSSLRAGPNNPLYFPARPQIRDVVPIEQGADTEGAQHTHLLLRGVSSGATRRRGPIRGGSHRPGPIGLA